MACLKAGAAIIHSHIADISVPAERAAALYREHFEPVLEKREDKDSGDPGSSSAAPTRRGVFPPRPPGIGRSLGLGDAGLPAIDQIGDLPGLIDVVMFHYSIGVRCPTCGQDIPGRYENTDPDPRNAEHGVSRSQIDVWRDEIARFHKNQLGEPGTYLSRCLALEEVSIASREPSPERTSA